jgi:hypothetical protein
VVLLVLLLPKDPSGVDLVPLGASRGQAPPLPEVCGSGLHFLISFPILRQPVAPFVALGPENQGFPKVLLLAPDA